MALSDSVQPILVFDLDGTLAETAPDLVATLNMLLTREGFPAIPYETARGMVGGGARALIERGLTASLPPHSHRLGHEWALDAGNEAHVTVAEVDGPVDAALTAARETSGLAAAVCAEDEKAATAFIDAAPGL